MGDEIPSYTVIIPTGGDFGSGPSDSAPGAVPGDVEEYPGVVSSGPGAEVIPPSALTATAILGGASDGNRFDEIPSDALDENTVIDFEPLQALTGGTVSGDLSAKTPGTIKSNQMDSIGPSTLQGLQPSTYGWDLTIDGILDIPAWYTQILTDYASDGFAGCILSQQLVNSMFMDPDQGVMVVIPNIKMYGHINVPPTMKDPGITAEAIDIDPEDDDFARGFGSTLYSDPWDYDELEELALLKKFGWDSSITWGSSNVIDVCGPRIESSIRDIMDMLAAGTTTKQDIRRTTSRVNLMRSFESIREPEPAENLSIVPMVVKSIDPTTAGSGSRMTRSRTFSRRAVLTAPTSTPTLTVMPAPYAMPAGGLAIPSGDALTGILITGATDSGIGSPVMGGFDTGGGISPLDGYGAPSGIVDLLGGGTPVLPAGDVLGGMMGGIIPLGDGGDY